MSDWTKSGAGKPCLDPCDNERRFPRERRAASQLSKVFVSIGLAALTSANPGYARDRGQYANTNPEIKAWFDSLKSGKGPCCSDADGSAVSDIDWKSSDGHYLVRLEGEWIDVPDDAVIKEPNRVGRTMVWPIYREGKPVVRCFMPGSMT